MTTATTTTGRPGDASPGRFRRSLAARRRGELWGFLAPATVFFVVFFLFPLGYGVFMSTTNFTTGTFITGRAPFVGTANFGAVLSEPVTFRALANTLTITVVSVAVELVLGMLLALLFARTFPGSRWLPTLILLPWLLPAVVVATVWKSLLAGDGPINDVLASLGVPVQAWLANPATALPAVIVVAVWASLPYWATILGAALKQVPAEQLEAAQLDGAGAWRRLTAIVVPTIWPVVSVLVVMSVVYTLLIVDLVLVLTAGGPANSTVTLGLLSYRQAFQQFQFGLGGAYGMLLLGISALFAIVYTVMSIRRERDE
ncbi:multiple sugar transport system permease protein [Microbacterium sp. ru370.1]|uniref:carbohydrate ABC transporter permease n=1 Tax=unclassified Microbacterium TaxID=2609290 RepID=UPI000891E38F|nr:MULTISPECIES: sugar ABC transporter permease [unclassified Microbacterium]SDO92783.1 multiple sugar transport system permease protein [Microbacterium sp. ru370.1]SIT93293.1 multiple sugar transport system permease protein [Microbacterium sp. RU1D]